MQVLIIGERSGKTREAFKRRGHNAWSCDLEPSEINGQHYQCDARLLDVTIFDLIIAHPSCQHTAVSGARWFKEKSKDGRQKAGIEFFLWCINLPVKKLCVEHPISIMSTIYRKPDQIVQPWMFGHGETKSTCYWLKGLPLLKPSNIVAGRENKIHFMSPGKDRSWKRSITYDGIAEAMANQWG